MNHWFWLILATSDFAEKSKLHGIFAVYEIAVTGVINGGTTTIDFGNNLNKLPQQGLVVTLLKDLGISIMYEQDFFGKVQFCGGVQGQQILLISRTTLQNLLWKNILETK